MFHGDLKSNVKDEITRKEMQYANLDAFIFAAISIDDNWYERILKNKFKKSMHDKVNIHHDELIKRREDYYQKEWNHNDEIVFMKIDFIEHRKKKNFRNEQEKRFKDKKKYYSSNKKDYFARDCRLKNKENRRQINILIKVSNKIETQEKESEIDISEINIDNEYYQIENVDKLWKVLNDTISDKIFANTHKVNDAIRRAFNRSKTSYLYENRSKSDDEYRWSEEF